MKKVAIGTKQAWLNFTLGNTEYSEKYNLQKFEDLRSFVVISSEYSQLTLMIRNCGIRCVVMQDFAKEGDIFLTEGDIIGKMPKIAGKFVISVHVFAIFPPWRETFTHVPFWLRSCAVCAMEFR